MSRPTAVSSTGYVQLFSGFLLKSLKGSCRTPQTNRITEGEGSIAIFAVDPDSGALSLAGHCPSGGLIPRNMKLHPSGDFALVANQNSGNVVVFSVDKASGQLTRRHAVEGLTAPLCLQLVPVSGGSSL